MKTLWKEWRQQRGLVLFGICAGILWPLIEMAGSYATRKVWFTNWGSGIVAGGGAVFAIFLAMATGCADLRPGIDTFWQSRPVRIRRIFLVKLLIGMVLLAVAFAVVMVPDLWTGLLRASGLPEFVWAVFWTTWPVAVLMFGAGLLFLALTRDAAKAAFVTIWFGMLVYFLPLFLNALQPLNCIERIENGQTNFMGDMVRILQSRRLPQGLSWPQRIWFILKYGHVQVRSDAVLFVGVMLGSALAFTLLAAQAVKRNWRWQLGQKTIVWTLGASAALIFAVTLFQVRVDLQPARHKDGQALINPMPLDWIEPPLTQAVKDRGNRLFKGHDSGWIEYGGYLYVLGHAYESDRELGHEEWDRPVYHHGVLQVYRFPLSEGSSGLGCGGVVISSMTEMDRRYIGWSMDAYVRGDRLYVSCPDPNKADGPKTCVATLEITNPEQPRLIGMIGIKGRGQLVGHGDHAYVLGSDRWTVLSLKQPDQPAVVAQWTSPIRDRRGYQPQLPIRLSEPNSVYLPCSFRCQGVGDRILCTDGYALALLNLSEPNDPMLVYYENHQETEQFNENTRVAAMAMDQDCLYVSTQRGLIVRRLVRHADGHWSSERIGYRAATPLERLSGRNVSQLLMVNGRLVESNRDFGLLVYDVSDPARPRRVMHSDLYSDGIGIWSGLLVSLGYNNQLNLFDLPARAR